MSVWLHRISNCAHASYPLLECGYLTIGFGDMLENENCAKLLEEDAEAARSHIDGIQREVYGDKLRSRYSLARFLYDFRVDDLVVVPSWGEVSVYRITSRPIMAYELPLEGLHDAFMNPIVREGKALFAGGAWLDIGFARGVEPVKGAQGVRRNLMSGALQARLKTRWTNADISEFQADLDEAIAHARNGTSRSLEDRLHEGTSMAMLNILRRELDPSKLEKLIVWYLRRIGADDVMIPPKNEPGKKNGADVDVIATFDALRVTVYVQAKLHAGETDEWAVQQVREYVAQKADASGDIANLVWVLSTCDGFAHAAQEAAGENGTRARLIGGLEFVGMLLDVGFHGVDAALNDWQEHATQA